MLKRHPDRTGQLERQDVQATQFGDLRVAERNIEIFLQGQYSPVNIREDVSQIDGSALGGAAVVGSRDKTNPDGLVTMRSGQNAAESVRLASNDALNYAPGEIADTSFWAQRDPSDAPVDDQIFRIGMLHAEDGWYLRETAGSLDLVIRDGSGGSVSEEVLTPDKSYVRSGDLALTKDLLDYGRIYFLRVSHYGGGKIILGTRDSLFLDPRNPGQTERILRTYSATKQQLQRLYTRTANLPIAVEIENDPAGSTTPSSEAIYQIGDRQVSLFGPLARNPREPVQQLSNVSLSADTPTAIVAIRPKDRFEGMPNGVNCEITDASVQVRSGGASVRFWTEIDPTLNAATFDKSDQTRSSAEIAFGAGKGDLNADSGTGNGPFKPAAFVPGGGSFLSASSRADSDARQSLGREQISVVFVEALGGTATVDVQVEYQTSR